MNLATLLTKRRDRSGKDRTESHVASAERIRQAVIAALLALVMAFAMFLEPVDWAIWKVQSRLSDQKPSGEISYLHVDAGITSPAYPNERVRLARALDRLREQGARRVFVNIVLTESESANADAALIGALGRWGTDLTFVDRIDVAPDGRSAEARSSEAFAAGHPRAWQGTSSEWPGFVWKLLYSYRTSEGRRPSFAAALGEVPGVRNGDFRVGYGIRSRSIPTVDIAELLAGDAAPAAIAGKTIVIGTSRKAASPEYAVPGQSLAPPSYVAIHAAETLKKGQIDFLPGFIAAALLAMFLCGAAAIEDSGRRRLAYAAAAALPVYLFLIADRASLRIELSYCFALLVFFAALRSRSRWKSRLAQIDPDTGLPTFRAFTRRLASESGKGHVVVAKIHSYETILRSFDSRQRVDYLAKLVERLRVGEPRLPVYIEGHYLAWQVPEDNAAKLRAHLDGLRAIFAAPVTVGAHSVDVGITFGAAMIQDPRRDRSLAVAIAAAEETTEALEPIKLAEETPDSDTLWDLSLRARIDAAMEAGEVFCVYQPKVDISVDRVTGVEALVRWEDPERGFIPPMHFVMQCEKAGRMEYLTRYVLQSACSAAQLLHFRGNRITMSVNISATLLTDMRIVGIVRNVLQATGFDAHYLMLEITETARIRDLTQARTVLKALKALGTHLSMDDFGVGAANFEALQALPFDEIKIDRQFVSRAASSTKARAITASIVGLGTSARIAVVADGAETESDLQMLRDIGCWQVQGYALARPMPLTKLLTYMGDEGTHPQAVMV